MSTPAKDLQPDPDTPLSQTPLIPEPEFHDKMRAIFGPGGVTKEEMELHMKEHPDPPQKRGRKPKQGEK